MDVYTYFEVATATPTVISNKAAGIPAIHDIKLPTKSKDGHPTPTSKISYLAHSFT